MADGKRGHDYEVAIDQVCMLAESFNGNFNPARWNPYKNTNALPLPEKTTEETPESRAGWAMLMRHVGEVARSHPKWKKMQREGKVK